MTQWQRPPRPLLSRFRAFEMRGVTLKHPSRSWSGVRAGDGAVVLALWADDILSDEQGSSCLLWSPHATGAHVPTDAPFSDERRSHCRLALNHGGAEGLLVYGDSTAVDPDIVLALRVVERAGEYWAKWGTVTRLVGRRAAESPSAFLRQASG
ncbi:MAG TPA: hypothetical protein VGX52_11925 [Burkholderiales bacterium]|nr:hypothetical protein [Burkholderiales bacterium]